MVETRSTETALIDQLAMEFVEKLSPAGLDVLSRILNNAKLAHEPGGPFFRAMINDMFNNSSPKATSSDVLLIDTGVAQRLRITINKKNSEGIVVAMETLATMDSEEEKRKILTTTLASLFYEDSELVMRAQDSFNEVK